MIQDFRNTRGFSLVELSVILMIVGLLGAAAMETYRTWLQIKIAGDTESHRNLATNALTFFVANYGRLPCPAKPGLLPTDPAAGQEDCLTTVVGNGCLSGLCRIDGARDADGDGALDKVLMGSLPYASLGLSIAEGVDGWRNKITYAVTEKLTATATYAEDKGAINIKESVRDSSTGVLPVPTNKANTDVGPLSIRSFMFVMLSHGPDGKGAWSYQGAQITPCGTYNVNGYDSENCDGDAEFINADPATGIVNRVTGATYFDDAFTVYKVNRDNDKWSYSTTTSMKNKTGGRVGIGVKVPGADLDVGGNILLEDFEANEYCSQNGNCFKAEMVGGSGPLTGASQCGDMALTPPRPMLMKGVDGASSNKLDCANVVSTTSVTPSSCPPGQYMKGINATGGIICQAP